MRKLIRLLVRLLLALFILSVFYISREIMNNYSDDETVNKKEEYLDTNAIVNKTNIIKNNVAVKEVVKTDGHNHEYVTVNDKLERINFGNAHMKKTTKEDIVQEVDNRIEDSAIHLNNDDRGQEKITFPQFVEERSVNGLGELGSAVHLTMSPDEQKEADRLYKLNDFSQYISDRISVHRTLDDTREASCKRMEYPSELPRASVIICFHNEAWSVLLRSVHSILDRSPPHMLEEIILVDDFSTMEHLKAPLNLYMSKYPKVKIIRAKKREGLIRGRLLGYDVATGPVLVFLDSHIECFPGWLEPMLARIRESPRAVVFPRIPSISSTTFSLRPSTTRTTGSFRWDGLTFTWGNADHTRSETAPIRSPTMPGGLFAIDKEWFTILGTYDSEMNYWGGENIELSFKAWMCNGTVEIMPCSQVGHIYRRVNPIKWDVDGVSAVNVMRVAEVWMDDYKELFYDYSFARREIGDVSDRVQLRDSLHCHSFQWYMKNVYTGDVPPKPRAVGEVRVFNKNLCLDDMNADEGPGLYPCHGKGWSQRFVYTEKRTLQRGLQKKVCYDGTEIKQKGCYGHQLLWDVDFETGTIKHANTEMCLTYIIPNKLAMETCNGNSNQRWVLPSLK